jgi:type VI secretion system protein ImpA
VTEVVPLDATTLPDLSDEAPAGENLELDAEFGALERAAQGRPETQYGETINPATPPDWKETEALALALLERTRDLRVMTHLAIARLHLAGVPGFVGVLGQIRDQLENRWQQVHPQLDPEDDNDPTLRANALYQLQDPDNVRRPLRDLPLATSPKTGAITWRDIAVFNGSIAPEPGRDKPTEATIRGAFHETNQARLNELREAVDRAAVEVAAIVSVFEAQAGAGTGPDFSKLTDLLGDIRKELGRFAVVVEDVAEEEEQRDEEPEMIEAIAQAPRPVASRGFASVRAITAVNTRDDALYLLEIASAYFRASEPSSPLPMLIDRARRLATMEFMDILRDLAPDGLGQAQLIAGSPPE